MTKVKPKPGPKCPQSYSPDADSLKWTLQQHQKTFESLYPDTPWWQFGEDCTRFSFWKWTLYQKCLKHHTTWELPATATVADSVAISPRASQTFPFLKRSLKYRPSLLFWTAEVLSRIDMRKWPRRASPLSFQFCLTTWSGANISH